MLNMTALKISLEKGREDANKYAFGVSIITIPQVIIAVILTKYIAKNPLILETLEKAGIIVFILLSYYFYSASKKGKVETKEVISKKDTPFLSGITLSILNMFSIPFFSGTVIALDVLNVFDFNTIPVLFFALGVVIGTFYILFLYGKFAKIIQKKTGKLTKDINIILAMLTAIVAIFTIIKLFF